MALKPTERFSNRVENYVKYRPGYPIAVVDLLAARCGLTPASVVADVGSGTGLLAKLWLDNGNRVYGIEPNREMREAGERFLRDYPAFSSLAATAEATMLPDASVDFVTAGQAFHWFDPGAARREFVRILKPGGYVALVWNDRQIDTTPFLQEYERLLQTYCPEYAVVTHKEFGEAELSAWYGQGMQAATFENSQLLDYESLEGRLLSSSYAPLPGDQSFQPMIGVLKRLFAEHQVDGKVAFLYSTMVYFGQL